MDITERLNSTTYILDGHLLWGGASNAAGYGHLKIGEKLIRAHRLAWELAYGPIPKGVYVLHTCDTPPCILPWHLYLGTHYDNVQDRLRAGHDHNTNKSQCKRGHLFNRTNTSITVTGRRRCRVCHREQQRRYYQLKRDDG